MTIITLATLPKATAQEVYDQVVTHLRKQNAYSMMPLQNESSVKTCAYRGEKGLMCAAGCLISDEEYDMDRMETCNWEENVRKGIFPPEHSGLIMSLQSVHDNEEIGEWEDSFRKIAQVFALTYTEPAT